MVLALDDFLAGDSARDIDAGDFIPRLRETYGSWNGKTYGFPLKADGRLMVYRTDVFEQHGKEPAKTWDEFLELAKYFNGKDWDGDGEAEFGAAYRFNADVIAIGRFAEMQAGMGGRLVDENFAPQLDTPESARALEMIVALAGQGPPDTMAMGFSEYTNTFLLGEVPHLVVWGQVPVTAEDPEKSKVVGNVGYAEVPGGAALLGGFGISVLASTKHPEAAYDFAAWFTSKETERGADRRHPEHLRSGADVHLQRRGDGREPALVPHPRQQPRERGRPAPHPRSGRADPGARPDCPAGRRRRDRHRGRPRRRASPLGGDPAQGRPAGVAVRDANGRRGGAAAAAFSIGRREAGVEGAAAR